MVEEEDFEKAEKIIEDYQRENKKNEDSEQINN
jgi:hypothetical protein